jgi:hypothetical protein
MTPSLTERVIHLENTLTERVTLLEHSSEKNSQCISELADGWLGTRKTDFAGGGRNQDGGIHRLQRIEALLSNGGVKVSWSRQQKTWVGILVIVITTAAEVARALI